MDRDDFTLEYMDRGFGKSIAVGDVNGDGFDDIIVSTTYNIWVYKGPVQEQNGWSWANPMLKIGSGYSQYRHHFYSVTLADVNNDGLMDIIFGEDEYNQSASPWFVYVFYGNTNWDFTGDPLHPTLELDESDADWIQQSPSTSDGGSFGKYIANAGDVNADGIDDIIIGAPTDSGKGKAYIFYGSSMGLPVDHQPDGIVPPSGLWEITQEGIKYQLESVGSAVNRDGHFILNNLTIDNFIVGMPNTDIDLNQNGGFYESNEINIGSALIGPRWWALSGDKQYGAKFGYALGNAGDVNGDNHPEVLVAARKWVVAPKIFLYLGDEDRVNTTPRAIPYDWSVTNIPYGQINNAESPAQPTLGSAGDINHDSYGDIYIGDESYNPDNTLGNDGRVHIWFGGLPSVGDPTGLGQNATPETSDILLSPSYISNYSIRNMCTNFGHSVAVGDINGDNLTDIIVGDPGAFHPFGGTNPGVRSGAVHVFYSNNPGICINETFTAASGTITDNSGALDYQSNMACEKLIQPSGGGTITLTFTSFATESGYDFVRVYGGTTTSAPLLGTFSGSSLPPVLTSSAGSMLIRFTTDGSVVAAGWSATYTTGAPPPTGCINETFTAASGTITDNSGALDYQSNMACEKLIQPSGGGTITLTFTSFATESGYDFVRVYGGTTTSAPLLGTFSGSSLPPVLTSSAGSMLLRFTTDGSVVAAGWSATYTTGAPPPTGCINETFTAASGTITDNSGALDYQNNMTCEKLIQPSGGGTITLTFTSFATESGYDFVRVYGGTTTSAPLLGTFSGSSLPPVLTSGAGSMLIRFTTDGSVVAAGWSATYTTGAPPPTGCINETFTAASGTITDNSGALDYQSNMACEKLIQPSGGGTITLTFTSFATESGYDFVRVYGGTTTSAPLLGTFSGSSLPPVLTSSAGSMLIRFTTDGSVVAAGWSATYTTGAPPPTGCVNETFTAASGTITDNSGALDYQNNMTCEKLIQPSGGGTITLTFTSFATESGYDFVRVYGGSTTSAPLLGTFSGSSLPPVLTSSGGSMLLRFTTDGSVVAAGWSATYTTGAPPPTGCINETFTAASGTITDNSGALDYQNNMTCEKLIQRLSPGYITLTFTSFVTESGYDYVRIYDGPTTSAALLGEFSGSSLPPTLTSSRVMGMLIRFTTDGSVVAAGWSATYTSSLTSGGKGAEEISEQEILRDTKLVAYPNPTSGILTVESSFTEEETCTIELINAYGQIILNQKMNIIGGKFDIDMSDVSSGLYLLQIRTGRTIESMRVIKN